MAAPGKIRAGAAFVELFADDSKLKQGLRRAGAALKAFGQSASTLGRSIATTAAMAAFPIALSLRTFKKFDDEMRFVQATSQAIGAEFDMLTAKARELGRTTSFTATQVASAMAELGRGGFKPTEIDAAIASILDLARATRTDIPTATKIAINVLRVFGIEASKMTNVVDILVTVANNSTTSLVELGESMKFASATAANLGLSAKQTAKILGVLATLGLGASLSGTSFNQLMIQLTRPDALRKLEQFGIGVKQLNAETGKIDIRAPDEILLELGKFLSKLGNIERTQILKDLFGIRGARAGGRFAGSTKVFNDMTKALENVDGAGRRAAETMDAGLGGVWRRLLSAIDDLQIAIGTALEPALMRMGTRFKESIVDMSNWVDSNEDAIKTTLTLIGALGVLGVTIWAVGTAATAVGIMLTVLGGPLGIAIGAIAIGFGALAVAFVHAKIEGIGLGESVLDLTNKITGLANAYTNLRDAEAKVSRERREFGGDLIERELKEPEFRGSVEQLNEQEKLRALQQADVAGKKALLEREQRFQDRGVPPHLQIILGGSDELERRLLHRKSELATAETRLRENELRMAAIREEELGKFFPEEQPLDEHAPQRDTLTKEQAAQRDTLTERLRVAKAELRAETARQKDEEGHFEMDIEEPPIEKEGHFEMDIEEPPLREEPAILKERLRNMSAVVRELENTLRDIATEGRSTPEEQSLVDQFFSRSESRSINLGGVREVMQSHQDALDRMLIEGQEKGLDRTLDLIDQEYRVRIRKAEELFQDTEALEKQHTAKRMQAEEAAIDRQLKSSRDLADEQAELQIRATKRGSAQTLALLKEQRRQALRDAGGIDEKLIEKNFALREQIARAGSDSRVQFAAADPQGSNATQAAWIRHNFGRKDDPAQQSRDALVQHAKLAGDARKEMLKRLQVPQPQEVGR